MDILDDLISEVYENGLSEFIRGDKKKYRADFGVFTINFSSDDEWSSIWLTVRTTSWDFNYERSDIHDLISTVLVILLKGFGNISSSQITLENEFTEIPSEIYAKYILFERQNLYFFQLNDEKISQIESIIKSAFLADFILGGLMNIVPGVKGFDTHNEEERLGKNWASMIATLLEEDIESEHIGFMSRVNPSWKWYYSIETHISVFSINVTVLGYLKMYISQCEFKDLEGPNKRIVIYKNEFRNAVELDRLQVGTNILNLLESENEDVCMILSEDCAYLLGNEHIVCLRGDCGINSVNVEIESIKGRQKKEIDILFKPTVFEWNSTIDCDRFELLIREILQIEDGVKRVRKVGAGNEPDGGRDLEVEWVFPDKNPFKDPKDFPYSSVQNILVQCKAYSRNVGQDRVNNIRDIIDMHHSNGYLLVVSSNISRPLMEYLKDLRDRKQFWVEWWTRNEIEDKLRGQLDIVHRFNDIVKIKI